MRTILWRGARSGGFTLIELMVTVCIIGVLASVAVPTYSRFVMNSRGSEGTSSLGQLYKGAAAYWERGFTDRGLGVTTGANCLVYETAGCSGGAPVPLPWPLGGKQQYDFTSCPSFAALGFSRAEPGYFSFAWDANESGLVDSPGVGSGDTRYCGRFAAEEFAYVFYAASDIDEDSLWGGYSMAVYSTRQNSLRREAGFADLFTGADPSFPACPMCVSGVD